jgi:hypothetical protein
MNAARWSDPAPDNAEAPAAPENDAPRKRRRFSFYDID